MGENGKILKSEITVYYFNARSLKNKLLCLHNFLESERPDLVLITETWLNESITDSLILPSNCYNIFRKDRQDGYGGVLILSNNILKITNVEFYLPEIEIISIDVYTYQRSYRFTCCYRSPNSSEEYLNRLIECLKMNIDTDKNIFIFGDFNLGNINWENKLVLNNSDPKAETFLNFTITEGLNQKIYQPTHIYGGVLDLLLTNSSNLVNDINITAPFSNSDHFVIKSNIFIRDTAKKSKFKRMKLFRKGDYDGFNNFLLNVDWQNLFLSMTSVNEYYELFVKIINDAIEIFVPSKKIKNKLGYKKGFELSNETKLAIERKDKKWKYARHNRSRIAIKDATKASKHLRICLEKDAKAYEHKLVIQKDPKNFYSYMKRKLKVPEKTIELEQNGKLIENDEQKAEILNNFFVSVFTEDNDVIPHFARRNINELNSVNFDELTVFKTIKGYPIKTSSGPDNISSFLLNKLAISVSYPLSLIFQASLNRSEVPKIWKQGKIVPIYKSKGSRKDVKNYRPISLTSVPCRIMETIINKNLLRFLSNEKLISTQQYGFLPKKSTTTQLLRCVEHWASSINQSKCLDLVYLDLAKAFDSVSHTKLLHKLRAYGIGSHLLGWIEQYLLNRVQCVKLGSAVSKFCEVKSGVPQGSVLGPTLFLIFVNDLPEKITQGSNVFMYADDTKLFNTFNRDNQTLTLQNDLDSVSAWMEEWQLKLNADKCKIVHIGYGNQKHDYTINGNIVTKSECEKDLGVHISNDMKFSVHCSKICSKASQKINHMLRAFENRDPVFMIKIYKMYIRPTLEYNSVVWSPYLLKDIDLIEKIQRRFLKKIDGFMDISYKERLRLANLESLEMRRLKADLVMVYKIIHGHVDIKIDDFFSFTPSTVTTRGNRYKLRKKNVKNNTYMFSFTNRVVNPWNSLPNCVVEARSVAAFKKLLNIHASRLEKFMKGRAL